MAKTSATDGGSPVTPDSDWFPDEGGTDLNSDNKITSIAAGADIDAVEMTFDEMVAALGGTLVTTHELDPREQFEKDDLINIPFIIFGASIKLDGDFGTPWVTVQVKTMDNRVGWINDGSTGICRQLLDIAKKRPDLKALLVPKGLTKSTYNTVDNEGKAIVATTYYLSTAPGT